MITNNPAIYIGIDLSSSSFFKKSKIYLSPCIITLIALITHFQLLMLLFFLQNHKSNVINRNLFNIRL